MSLSTLPTTNQINMIIIKDSFVWLEVTNKAKEIFQSGLFELYVLHNDGSESLAESYADINDALECNLKICIEVGNLDEKIIL